ncbi:hypothetical protein [uncultured Shewanella sp.]|uniref:hypothetical protein n=1 Tax=Shewanella atlantica TaxID=271099 RepID=UPI0026280FED|nr:hypothetical protein [uncultured Shewanella sp.]
MKAGIAVLFLICAWNVSAQCDNNIYLTSIPYAKNSSYFPAKYSKELDTVLDQTSASEGYLLLEFQVTQQVDVESRKYNMWLAGRRINRVKTYLNSLSFPSPIVSKILTAGTQERRDVSISWCKRSEDASSTAIADNGKYKASDSRANHAPH